MLGDMLMYIVIVCLLFVMTLGGMELEGVVVQMDTIQNEAQVVARSEGVYGGYNTVAEASVEQFAQQHNLDMSQITVNASAPGAPGLYGTLVTAEITVPFTFKLGSFVTPFTMNLTGEGRSVSMYTQGITPAVTYCSP